MEDSLSAMTSLVKGKHLSYEVGVTIGICLQDNCSFHYLRDQLFA